MQPTHNILGVEIQAWFVHFEYLQLNAIRGPNQVKPVARRQNAGINLVFKIFFILHSSTGEIWKKKNLWYQVLWLSCLCNHMLNYKFFLKMSTFFDIKYIYFISKTKE